MPTVPKPQDNAPEDITLGAPEQIVNQMDPHLQEALLAHKHGEVIDPAFGAVAADGTPTVEVIAKLKDPKVPVPGLKVVRELTEFVTAEADLTQIEAIRTDPNVLSLKLARPVEPHLQFSVPEILADADQLGASHPGIDGTGVIVGVIDYDFDFVHKNFRGADDQTRLLALWDQNGGPTSLSPPGFGYGREFSRATINNALSTANPYMSLAYLPEPASHGTHVADIAAGNGRGTGVKGVAPGADLIFVNMGSLDFAPEQNFGNSKRLLEAVDYIFEKAGTRPVVINISLGTHGGPHDGTTPAEREFDGMLRTPGRAIVISAGNSFDAGGHASGSIAANTTRTLTWNIRVNDQTANELEVWYPAAQALEVTLVTPGGGRLGPVVVGATQRILSGGVRVGSIIHRPQDPLTSDNHINILLNPGLPTGSWKVELRNPGAAAVPFHAWIERDDAGQSSFVAADRATTHTIGSIACGRSTIAVGSYTARVPDRTISSFSSAGPTRDGREKPEISAPGHAILAARSRSATAKTQMSGTSMAAPHVTGCIALLMQAAGRPLSMDEIRAAVAGSARSMNGGAWDPRFGMGRIDTNRLLPAGAPVDVRVTGGDRKSEVSAPREVNGGPIEDLCQVVASAAARTGTLIRVQIEAIPHRNGKGGNAADRIHEPPSQSVLRS
jgi:subtilisin family serine protease